jgi:hypothetical protein
VEFGALGKMKSQGEQALSPNSGRKKDDDKKARRWNNEGFMERIRMDRKALMFVTLGVMLLSSILPAQDAAPRWQLIFAERFRFETWDNAVNLDDTVPDGFAYTRNRTTLGLRWLAAENVEVLGKVTNELRVYLAPKDRPFNVHELFVDNLAVKWAVPGRVPLTITAGRQDIFLGEGFVIADGTPGDGSRSYYFNAVRVDADLRPGHSLTAFFHAMDTTDKFLPVLNPRDQLLVEQPERAMVLYYAGSFGERKLDAYVIRKTARATEGWPLPARIDTFGLRSRVPFAGRFSLVGEGAFQTGAHGPFGRSAFGGILHLDTDLEGVVPLIAKAVVGGIFLSGDKPGTEKMEGWDPLFSRWPKWSDGYIYTLTRESRPAYWSNLTSLYGAITLDLGDRAGAVLTVHSLGAVEVRPGEFPGGAGLRRGTLLNGHLDFMISESLSGHFIWEHFRPGDFYRQGAANFNWLRFELVFKL